MKIIKLLSSLLTIFGFVFIPALCHAMPPGTLLYRTSSDGKMFGYSGDPLIYAEKGIIKDINSGHVGIYIGSEGGQDYVVEALGSGVVKTPAEDFVNLANGEKFLGAKIPKKANSIQIAKVVAIAKSLVGKNLGYDFDFKHQKGPGDGQWTCVGLAEKLYESANMPNPNNIGALEYDPEYYAVDITPDGFDNYSEIDDKGNCFSKDKEFSKISARPDLLIPAPELIGFDAGLEYNGERYIFLPYTQFLQPSLLSVNSDIRISSYFKDEDIRGSLPVKLLVLRWSLINNPLSSIKSIAAKTSSLVKRTVNNLGPELAKLKKSLLGDDTMAQIEFKETNVVKTASDIKVESNGGKTTTNSKIKASPISKSSNKDALPKINVTKALNKHNIDTSSVAAKPKDEIYTNRLKKDSSASVNNSKSGADKTEYAPETVVSADNKQTNVNGETSVRADKTKLETVSPPAVVTKTVYYPQIVNTPIQPSAPETPTVEDWPKVAKINRIYSWKDNDFVELINTTDHDFDLSEAGYRLEKTKTAENPSIAMRIGNPEDGAYPGGTLIRAHGTYLIVSAQADDYYRQQADAIATRKEFTWSDSGYTIYLGTGAISSSHDSDLVDAVGFGEATYFLGENPAPKIDDAYILSRSSYQDDNDLDFSLVASPDPEAIDYLATIDDTSSNNLDNSDNSSATTTEDNIATSTNDISSSTENIIATSTDIWSSTSTDDTLATTTDDISATSTVQDSSDINDNASTTSATSTDDLIVTAPPIFINKIYSTGENDWIELFNPNDYDVDLASSSYRLEKTKTSDSPSILIRLGNPEDGVYPGGTVIKSHGVYRIVRNDADPYYLEQADALASRSEFTWTGDGYSFYLASGAVSSQVDEDIQDLVGIGYGAVYFKGDGPAPEISENYVLSRQSFTNNNALDFSLVLSDNPEVIGSINDDSDLYIPPVPLNSPALVNIWHFGQCYGGEGKWAVGRWDCGQELGYNYNHFYASLDEPIDLDNFSLSFYYKKDSQYPRIIFKLDDDATDTNPVTLTLDPGMITVGGLPVSKGRYYLDDTIFDDNWHQVSLAINQPEDYWAVYIDGQELVRQTFFANLWSVKNIEAYDTNGEVIIDELALFNQALSPDQLLNDYLANTPYAPLDPRESQLDPELKYSWGFQEDSGVEAIDSIASTTIAVSPDSWIGHSHNNYALYLTDQQNYNLALPIFLQSPDLSLAFWWQNTSSPNEGRSVVSLKGGEDGQKNILSLSASDYRLSYDFNDQHGVFFEGLDKGIPNDGLWHHLGLVYDSYRYKLNLYIDGQIAASSSMVRLKDGETIKSLNIKEENFSSAIDDLNIYSGALSPAQLSNLYLNSK